jgi:hypothetical protein
MRSLARLALVSHGLHETILSRLRLGFDPIVHRPEFESLPRADDYVLFDPAQGLNEFSITGNIYADPFLAGSLPIEIGASFMQNFRRLADGAAFEQVFVGDAPASGIAPPLSVWGTLGIALRGYSVSPGYVPVEDPGTPFYFQSPLRSVPDSNGELTSNPTRWNIRPGMEPIEVLITAGVQRAQADFPDADILGAFERGVESWNEVFGFEALEAVFVHDDRVPDDDDNVVLVDYPGVGAGSAFGDWRNNPDNPRLRAGRGLRIETPSERSSRAASCRAPKSPSRRICWHASTPRWPRTSTEPHPAHRRVG